MLSLSVDFFASQYCRHGFTSVCGIAFILFFILLLLRFYATLFYIALSILSGVHCVYDFIINK